LLDLIESGVKRVRTAKRLEDLKDEHYSYTVVTARCIREAAIFAMQGKNMVEFA
jgi:hypothetical protein